MGLIEPMRLMSPISPVHVIPEAISLFKRFLNARMFSLAVVDGARRAYDVVGEIDVQFAVLDHLAKEGRQVARIQLAGVNRDGGGQVERSHDRHAVHVYGLAGFAQYAVTSGRP